MAWAGVVVRKTNKFGGWHQIFEFLMVFLVRGKVVHEDSNSSRILDWELSYKVKKKRNCQLWIASKYDRNTSLSDVKRIFYCPQFRVDGFNP